MLEVDDSLQVLEVVLIFNSKLNVSLFKTELKVLLEENQKANTSFEYLFYVGTCFGGFYSFS